MRRLVVWLPLIVGISLATGVMIGSYLAASGNGFFFGTSGNGSSQIQTDNSYNKIKTVLGYVQANYVDSVNPSHLTDITLEEMLQHLDPHSDYFTAEEAKEMDEPLQGNFEGIGIMYLFSNDTLIVDQVLPGGPSEKAGLRSGDRIVKANDTLLVGKFANEKFIRGKLRGPKGSKVTLAVKRPSANKMFDAVITRESIPIYSVESSYMIDKQTGYVRLARFAETSYSEFVLATDSLLKHGMKKLVLDLRGNGGGFLDQATAIADEFLPEGQTIIVTRGRVEGEERTLATKKGKLENMPLAVLVDENSASASEILAGALQDNDRGIIIGRRTFGKGLVQEEKTLNDGSKFRLTIARYYTPTGRSIQKPYNKGLAAYEADEQNRYNHGELLNADSIKFPDSLKFKTPKGKTVYGGGGIMPDIFVPIDTGGGSTYLNNLFYKDIFTLWSMDFVQNHKAELGKNGIENFRHNFSITDPMVNDLVAIGEKNGVKKNDLQFTRSHELILSYMKSYVARGMWGNKGYYEIWNDSDKALKVAVDALNK
jgi:carboxyl-terminal processing protease